MSVVDRPMALSEPDRVWADSKLSPAKEEAPKASAMGRFFQKVTDYCKTLPWKKIGAIALFVFAVIMAVSFGAMAGLGTGLAGIAMFGLGAGAVYFGIHLLKKNKNQDQTQQS
jgi:hypothetical protein